jgi:hypothetical protein
MGAKTNQSTSMPKQFSGIRAECRRVQPGLQEALPADNVTKVSKPYWDCRIME